MHRIFLMDDQELVRRGMRRILQRDDGLDIIGESATAHEAVAMIPALHPDVAVLDVRLPDGNGINVCRTVRAIDPAVNVLMFTGYDDIEAVASALSAGAAGYLLKSTSGSDLVAAIHAIARGESVVDPTLLAPVLRRLENHDDDQAPTSGLLSLTPREHLILTLVTEGLTNREIGNQVTLSESTVKHYVSSILAKLGVEHRAHAAVLASQSLMPSTAPETGETVGHG